MASNNSINKGTDEQRTIVELEHQLSRLKRQLIATHEQLLKQTERRHKQVLERIGKLRQQLGLAQDRVKIARDEARMKSSLTADRQLQRAQARAAKLKAAVEEARATETELKQEVKLRRSILQHEQQVARASQTQESKLRQASLPTLKSKASKPKASTPGTSKPNSVPTAERPPHQQTSASAPPHRFALEPATEAVGHLDLETGAHRRSASAAKAGSNMRPRTGNGHIRSLFDLLDE